MQLRVFNRQYVVARRSVEVDRTWLCRALSDGWVLSWQRDLDVADLPTEAGGPRLVLGDPLGGRVVHIDWPWVAGDGAGSLLPVFFGADGNGLVAASTPSLVALALGRDPVTVDLADALRHHAGMNYLPVPGSRYRGVRRLFRDERLNLVESRSERSPSPFGPLGSAAEAIDVLVEELRSFARGLAARTPGTIFAQLTAGLDTRTIVAALVAEGVPFEAVTMRSRAKPEVDIVVAGRIARSLGIRHHVVDLVTPPDYAATAAYRLQTGGATNGWDMTDIFPGGGYRFLGPDDTMVGGLCFGIGREKLSRLGDLDLANATGAEIWRRLDGNPGPAPFVSFLDDWLTWRRAAPYPVDLAASFYIDQRIPAWMSALMGGLDLLPGRAYQPANNSRVLAALITPSRKDRVAGSLQKQAIGRLAPALLDFPLNPPSLRHRIRKPLGWVRRLMRGVRRPLVSGPAV